LAPPFALTESYWKCDNSKEFLDIVKELAGKELTGESWVDALLETIEDRIKRERNEYDEALAKESSRKRKHKDDDNPQENLDATLNMTIKFVDGDTLIANSSQIEGGILGACTAFEQFVAAR
jgi:hypothetical protein